LRAPLNRLHLASSRARCRCAGACLEFETCGQWRGLLIASAAAQPATIGLVASAPLLNWSWKLVQPTGALGSVRAARLDGRTARSCSKEPSVSSARDRRIGARGVRLPGDPAAADAIGSSWPAGVLADPPTQPSSAEAVELPGMKQKPSDHRVGWPCHLSRATLAEYTPTV